MSRRTGTARRWLDSPARHACPPPPGSERLLLNNMVTPRFLKPAEKLICFRSVETVKDISRRFFLMNMKGLIQSILLFHDRCCFTFFFQFVLYMYDYNDKNTVGKHLRIETCFDMFKRVNLNGLKRVSTGFNEGEGKRVSTGLNVFQQV